MQRRSRLLRPEFFEDETLADLGDETMLVLAGLWIVVDRDGRIQDSARLIQSQVRPFNPGCDIESILQSLSEAGYIYRYSVADRKLIQICGWLKQQTIHHRERKSELPAPQGLARSAEVRLNHGPWSEVEEEAEEEVKEEAEEEAGVEPEVSVLDEDCLPWNEDNELVGMDDDVQ